MSIVTLNKIGGGGFVLAGETNFFVIIAILILAGCAAPEFSGDVITPQTMVPAPLTATITPAPLPELSTADIPASPMPTQIPSPTPLPDELVWFAPNMGSTDFTELFTNPNQWADARSRIDVFKFYTQNVLDNPCTICGDNILSRFAAVDAFQKLKEWGIPISIEVGAVKEWGCTGKREAEVAIETIRNVTANGGNVAILSMDEPLLGGQLVAGGNTCGQTMQESARTTAVFFEQIHTQYPGMIIGDIEPYPHFSAIELENWVLELEKNGVSPAFFHLDVDVERVRVYDHNVIGDLRSLAAFFEDKGIPFGVIFTSNWKAAGSNKTYFDSTILWIRTVNNAIGKPEHIIFQSWQGPAASGAHEIPINLPLNDPEGTSHMRLILEGLEILAPYWHTKN